MASKKSRIKTIRRLLIVLCGVGLITFGAWSFWQKHQATHTPPASITKTVITHAVDTPSETKPTDACAEYQVADDHPKRIDIPSIKAGGCITQVGIDQHGAIAAPDNIYNAGWYVKSALPGQPGLSVIDGHISGRYKEDGIFQHLTQLKNGDEFRVTLGSGKVLNYKVFKTQSVPLDKAAKVLLTKDSGVASQLNLITCAGNYDKATDLYDHRAIVSAELID